MRFVQVNFSYPRNYWDAHGDLRNNHTTNAKKVDQPIAALLADLKARGLLDDTLVIFGTEFGRTPAAQGQRRPRPPPHRRHRPDRPRNPRLPPHPPMRVRPRGASGRCLPFSRAGHWDPR